MRGTLAVLSAAILVLCRLLVRAMAAVAFLLLSPLYLRILFTTRQGCLRELAPQLLSRAAGVFSQLWVVLNPAFADLAYAAGAVLAAASALPRRAVEFAGGSTQRGHVPPAPLRARQRFTKGLARLLGNAGLGCNDQRSSLSPMRKDFL